MLRSWTTSSRAAERLHRGQRPAQRGERERRCRRSGTRGRPSATPSSPAPTAPPSSSTRARARSRRGPGRVQLAGVLLDLAQPHQRRERDARSPRRRPALRDAAVSSSPNIASITLVMPCPRAPAGPGPSSRKRSRDGSMGLAAEDDRAHGEVGQDRPELVGLVVGLARKSASRSCTGAASANTAGVVAPDGPVRRQRGQQRHHGLRVAAARSPGAAHRSGCPPPRRSAVTVGDLVGTGQPGRQRPGVGHRPRRQPLLDGRSAHRSRRGAGAANSRTVSRNR